MFSWAKTEEKYHIYKLPGLQKSESIYDRCESMEDFNEEDIWGGVNDAEANQVGLQENGCNVVAGCKSKGLKEGNINNSRRTVNVLPKESCHEESNRRRIKYQSSAAVNIPNRSRMEWKQKRKDNGIIDDNSEDDEDNGGNDFERIPPHELIAGQFAQREITSFSVYEGIGRNLKGRDLIRVRNAVLTRTGFIE